MVTYGQLQWRGRGAGINPLVYHSQHVALFIGSLWGNSNRLHSGSDSVWLVSIVRPTKIGTLLFPSFSDCIFSVLLHLFFHPLSSLRLLKYMDSDYVHLFYSGKSLEVVHLKFLAFQTYGHWIEIWNAFQVLSIILYLGCSVCCYCLVYYSSSVYLCPPLHSPFLCMHHVLACAVKQRSLSICFCLHALADLSAETSSKQSQHNTIFKFEYKQ